MGKKEMLENEVAAVKQAEEEAMARALGFKPSVKNATGSLTKRDMMEVCKRRTDEYIQLTGQVRAEGIGYKSEKNAFGNMVKSKDDGGKVLEVSLY
jgi:hypothetical protein